MMATQSPGKVNGRPSSSLWIHVVAAIVGGIITCMIALLLFSEILCHVDLPICAAVPLATAAISLGSAVGGLLLARAEKKNGLVLGVLSGLFFFAAAVLAAFLLGQRDVGMLTVIRGITLTVSGAIGGYLGIVMTERAARHRMNHG